ncbi:MAG TPA: glycosyltransferase [Firmicutes bacterium]|nr:glycosyltransferase [Bacillota bacterium]
MTEQRRRRRVAMVVYNDLVHDARVYKTASTVRDAGYDVHVIGMVAPESGPLGAWDGIRVTRLDVGVRRSLRVRYAQFWRAAYRVLRADTPDVIHANDLDVLVPCWLAARKLRIPIVHDAHELWVELPSLVGRPHVRAIWSAVAHALISRCDAVITVSDGVAGEIRRRYGVEPTIVRNLPIRGGPVEPAPLRDRLGIPDDAPILIYQGGLLPGLGIERAVDAMDFLPQAHLVIIGGGPLRELIARHVEQSPSRDRINLLPPVPFAELKPITTACDIGLYLGSSAGLNLQYALPNKLFEYIAAHVPSVITDWPDQAAIVRHYGVGTVVPPNASPEHVAGAVRDTLANRDSYVANCRVAANELVWENDAARLLDVYAKLPYSTDSLS